jgi:hypothetical protein
MKFARPALVGTVTLLSWAIALPAEEAKPAAKPATTPSVITAGLPRYVPPKTPAPQPSAAAVDKMEAEPESTPLSPDQPQGKIIRLPRYVVEESRPPVFRESDIHTKKDFGRILAKRYLTEFDRGVLNRFTLPIIGIPPEARALTMFEDEERLRNIAEFKNAADLARLAGDKKEADFLLRETNRTFLRSGGSNWNTWRP